MITRVRLQQIQTLAREKLIEHRRMHLPVKPIDFARQLDILVEPFTPPQDDVSGFIMRVGNSFGIGYSTAISSVGFQHFTVAHELGHYFIDDHPLAVLSTGKHHSRSGYISKDRYEEEADAFATELLMPWKLIEPLIGAKIGGFGTIKAIADGCESSLLASAIRFTQVTKGCVAVIVSYLGTVEFMTASETFRQIPGLDWLRRRDSLPTGVASKRFSTELQWIREGRISEEGARLSEWFPGTTDREVEEDVVGLGSYGRLLTVLTTDEDEDEGDGDDDEQDDYIDRWKQGLFRG